MELASSGDQHQLFLTINHAGIHLQTSLTVQSSANCASPYSFQCKLEMVVLSRFSNCAGIDGIGLLHLCNSLLANLSKLSQGQSVTAKVQRPFRDVFTNMDAWLPMGINKQPKPTIPAQYMPTLTADRMLEDVEPHVAAAWSELDANWTQALLAR